MKRPKKVPKKLKPRSMADLQPLLFPRSPIVLERDFTVYGGEHVYEWHVYCEGQWMAKEPNLELSYLRVMEVIESQGHDWSFPSLRIVPDWDGWKKISKVDLAEFHTMSMNMRTMTEKELD